MDVTKMPAAGIGAPRAPAASAPEQGPQTPANSAAIPDRADIRSLHIPAALQILLAEVRAAFDLQAIQMGGDTSQLGGDTSVTSDSSARAARVLVETVLQSMPESEPSVPVWSAALVRVESALQTGLERAINAVTVWHDVPAAVVDAAHETRALVLLALSDEPQNPLWLRPEWAGLAPRFERFWRRRRFARRRLTDPDYSSGTFDDNHERGA
jgi:hypothetical protein